MRVGRIAIARALVEGLPAARRVRFALELLRGAVDPVDLGAVNWLGAQFGVPGDAPAESAAPRDQLSFPETQP